MESQLIITRYLPSNSAVNRIIIYIKQPIVFTAHGNSR